MTPMCYVTSSHRGVQVLGAPEVYALGDCATIEQPKLINHLAALFKEADTNGDQGYCFDVIAPNMTIACRSRP